jgi:hypothetical protein
MQCVTRKTGCHAEHAQTHTATSKQQLCFFPPYGTQQPHSPVFCAHTHMCTALVLHKLLLVEVEQSYLTVAGREVVDAVAGAGVVVWHVFKE